MFLKRTATVVSILVQIAAIGVLILLLRQNLVLRRLIHARVASVDRFAPGDRFVNVPVIDSFGRSTVLDLERTSAVVLIVDPSCESCVRKVSALGDVSAIILSLAPIGRTQSLLGPAPPHVTLLAVDRSRVPPAARSRFTYYPQILSVEHGRVVRTCAEAIHCGDR